MARLYVGLPHLEGEISDYAEKFDMVELRLEGPTPPRPATLRSWRRAVNPSFSFAVCLPRIVEDLPMSDAMLRAVDESVAAATALEARCIVLVTSSEVRPTQANLDKIRAVVERLPRPSVVLCWEARGIWERREVLKISRDLSLLPVIDATQDPLPPGPIAYTRLRSLGTGQRIGARAVDRMAGELQSKREAWVVVEHAPSARKVRAELGQALARLGPHESPAVARPVPGRMRAEDEEQDE